MNRIILFIFVYITHTSPNKSVATIETLTLEQVALIYKPVTCTTAALLSELQGGKINTI